MADRPALEDGQATKKIERPHTLKLTCKLDLPSDEETGLPARSESVTKIDFERTPGAGWRHIQLLLMSTALMGSMSHRTCLSVAIVVMTEPIPGQEVFTWSREQQGTILSAFLWGYAVTQIPAGYLTTRFGAKVIMGTALFITSIISFFTPLIARNFGWVGLMVSRIVMGLCQGTTFPGMYTLMGKWAVPQERGRASAFGFAAQPLGIFLGMALSGVLAENLGWPSTFYFFGCLTTIIGIFWFVFCADSPDVHPWISAEERTFILQAIGEDSKITKGPAPWKAMLTSIPLISSVLNSCGSVFGLWLLMTAMPRYMNDMFQFSISVNGAASSFPYIFMMLVSFLCGFISDFLIKKNIFGVGVTRKIFNTIGCWAPAIALITLTLTPNDHKRIQVFELTTAVGFMGCTYSGVMANFVELSPRFAGLTFAICNFVASIVAAIAPVITGVFVQTWGETKGWAAAFYVAAGVFFVTGFIWILGASSEQQPWNDVEAEPITDDLSKDLSKDKETHKGTENQSFRAD